ncbi:MAG: glycosyltransferase family 4 protein [Ignavibacteriales bacterium]|nr:glycosyltransferase family 4 protein [Ignavibacteriales bacterium]MCF8314589.1 glycosyltransferase family 4 protein [Ignavibacteriales bacterium]MCF8436374.1 glycosyltransferase family 4 protein [Ignavibacteriales bacterium]
MKLIILTQYFYPEIGAAASRLLELSKGLKKRGWEISVISAMPNYPTGKIFKNYKGKFSVTETVDGIKVKRYWLFASNSQRVLPRIINMLSFAFSSLFSFGFIKKQKPEYILVESPPLLLGLSGYVLAKATGSRLIMNVADLWPLSALELNAISQGFLYRQIEKIEEFIYKQSDICLGQSGEIVTHLKKKGANRTHLFRNGVDTTRFLGHIHSNGRANKKLVYAGLIGVAQGILNLCKKVNFKDFDIELHIFGDGAERKELLDFIESNPGRNIFVHKPVRREEIPSLLKEFDGSVIPLVKNIYGAVPSKIYESMAAGLPIIFSGNGEGASIIQEYQVGWASKPGDYDKLIKNIQEFRTNSQKSEFFRNNGYKAANETFNRDIQIDKLHYYLVEEIKETRGRKR